MNESAPKILATVIRPLLPDVGQVFNLPDGILGIALAPDPSGIAYPHIYFAEFVGPSYPPTPICEERLRSSDYEFSRGSLLSLLLFSDVSDICHNLPPAQLRMHDVRHIGREYESVAKHLDVLFSSAKPEIVCFYRMWLKQRASILYYVPRDQEMPSQWEAVVRSTRLVAGYLRTSMVIVAAADEADSDGIEPLVDCLPAVFGDHEARLRAMIAERLQLKARFSNDVRDISIEIDYRKSINQIVFVTRIPTGQSNDVISLRCTQGTHLCGKTGANLIVHDRTKQNAKRKREMKQTLALFMLNKALSKDPDSPSKIHYAQAYRFLNAGKSEMPPGDGLPADPKVWQDAVGIRVRRAHEHLGELLGVSNYDRGFRSVGSSYELVLKVTRSEAFSARVASAGGASDCL